MCYCVLRNKTNTASLSSFHPQLIFFHSYPPNPCFLTIFHYPHSSAFIIFPIQLYIPFLCYSTSSCVFKITFFIPLILLIHNPISFYSSFSSFFWTHFILLILLFGPLSPLSSCLSRPLFILLICLIALYHPSSFFSYSSSLFIT